MRKLNDKLVVAEYLSGITVKEIAKNNNCYITAIYKCLKRNNIRLSEKQIDLDWNSIQSFYDSTISSINDVKRKFNITRRQIENAMRDNLFTKKSDTRISQDVSKRNELNPQSWTNKQKEEQSLRMQQIVKSYPESYSSNNVCGRAKKIEYKDIILHSTWEHIVAIYFDNNDIEWIRCSTSVPYEFEGKIRQYFPDFYLPKIDKFVEVKGYRTARDDAKIASLGDKIIVIDKANINSLTNNLFK